MDPDESIRAFEKASHAAAQGLCMEKHGDARYDPGKPKHRKWLKRGQAAVAFAEPFLRADERRKVIAELTTIQARDAAAERIDAYVPLTAGAYAIHGEAFEEALYAAARPAGLLASVEDGDMSNMHDTDPDPQAAHTEEASA